MLCITPLELMDESFSLLMGAGEDKMHVIRHQDKRQDRYRERAGKRRNQIHPHLEIRIIPEPDPVRQMIRRNQPDLKTILQNTHISQHL